MTIGRQVLRVAAALAVGCALEAPAHAQSVTSTVRGQVVDEAGQGISGAKVSALDVGGGVTRTAESDGDGTYQIPLLRPGRYEVSVEVPGYAPAKAAVELPLNTARVVDFTLQMAISEHVQVSGEALVFDPSRTSLGNRIDQATIQSIPLNGREFTDLALLDSAVRPAAPGVFFGEQGNVLTLNGSGARSNAFLVDGSDNNDFVFGSRSNGAFSAEVIQEFQVLTDGYSAEFGRASGGVLNIITRSGTNDFSGSAFYTFTGDNLNSTDAIVAQSPGAGADQTSLERQQFGFAVSGPFVRDKAFYFAAYEGGRKDDMIGYTGVDRNGVAGGAFPASADGDRFFLRTDFNLSPVNYLSARLSYSDEVVEGVNVIGRFTPEVGSRIHEEDLQAALSLRSVASANLYNEARFLWSGSDSLQQANSDRPGVERPQGNYGGNDLNRRDLQEEQFQFIDNITILRRNHTLKLGLDASHLSVDIATGFNPNGVFSYGTREPFEPGDSHRGTRFDLGIGVPGVDDDGDGIIDEERILGTYPEVYRLITGAPTAAFEDTVVGLFIQDEWRPHPDWNLNFGLRYDVETFELDEELAVPSAIPNGGAKRDTDNIAPRFSFTWSPGERKNLIVRGGVGIFYDKVVLGFPAISAITANQTIQLAFPQGFGFPCNEDVLEEFGLDVLIQCTGLLDLNTESLQMRFSTGDTMDTPYTAQWNLGFDRTLGRQLMLGLNYVHSRGYHVSLFRDLNPIVGGDPNVRGLPLHRDTSLGSIAAIETMGNTWYDGVQLRLQDGAGDLTYLISYTWSKSLDQSADPLRGGIFLPPDSDDIAGERARSDNDQRHRFVFTATWYSSWWKLKFSPLITYASGAPFNVTLGVDDNSWTLGTPIIDPVTGERVPLPDGFKQERPDGVDRNSGADTSLAAVNAARAELGVEPFVGELDEPDFLQVDLRISRLFQTGGSSSLEGFLQIFNLLDRTNYALVDGEVISPTFGEPLALAGPARIVEMGVRFGF